MKNKSNMLDALLATSEGKVKSLKVNIDYLLETPGSIPDHTTMAEDVYAMFEKLDQAMGVHDAMLEYAAGYLSEDSCEDEEEEAAEQDLQEDGFI